LLTGLEFADSSQTNYSSLENYIPLELKILFLEPKVLKVICGNLNSITFDTTTHALAAALEFAIQNYITILVTGIVGAGHVGGTVGINNIGKNNILFVFC
jgi:hypothetical protein